MKYYLEYFAERIKELREKSNMTQMDVANMIKVSRTSINLYESRKRTPDISVLRKYAEYFGATADYLLGLSDDPDGKHGQNLGLSAEQIRLICEHDDVIIIPRDTLFEWINSLKQK